MPIRRRKVSVVVLSGLLTAVGGVGCGPGAYTAEEVNSPGANGRSGSILVRYAHIAQPPDGSWRRGDDAPVHLRVFNKGRRADTLRGAVTPAAGSVEIVGADGGTRGPVTLPPGVATELEAGRPHVVLTDLRERVYGGDYVRLTLRFGRADDLDLHVPVQPRTYVEDETTESPSRQPSSAHTPPEG